MHLRFLFFHTLAFTSSMTLLQGCTEAPLVFDKTHSFHQSVHYGEPDHDEEGTVKINNYKKGTLCSGSMITPTLILTANHCVDNTSPFDWVVSIGQQPRRVSGVYGVEIVSPGPYIEHYTDDDIALLVVNKPIPVPIYQTIYETGEELWNQRVKIVGYGLNEDNISGVRRYGWMEITDIHSIVYKLSADMYPGKGDSGGPVLDSEKNVIAVIARAGPGRAIVTRVDTFRWLIDPVLRANGGCIPFDEEICDGIDNNCDGIIDTDCLGPGELCNTSEDCTTQLCGEVNGQKICTIQCSPEETNECWGGSYCYETSCGAGLCRPGIAGSEAFGDICNDDLDCLSLLCRDIGDGVTRCTKRCSLNTLDCDFDQSCTLIEEECSACFSLENATLPRDLATPCETDSQCQSEFCLHESTRSYCSTTCDKNERTCPEIMHCREGVCIVGTLGTLGSRCETEEDCEIWLDCLPNEQGIKLCTEECFSEYSWCPEDSTCNITTKACEPDLIPFGFPCNLDDGIACLKGECLEVDNNWICTENCNHFCPNGFLCTDSNREEGLCVPQPIKIETQEGCQCVFAHLSTTSTKRFFSIIWDMIWLNSIK